MSEVKDWCKKPEVCNTLGNGWCVRISGTDVFDIINQYGCKTLRTFDIVRGLSNEEEAKAYLAQWLKDQLPDYDAQRLRADTAEAELKGLRVLSADQGLNLKRVKREFDSMKSRAEAAEQRIAELLDLLRDINDAPGGSQFRKSIEAALNPKPEAASTADCTCWLQPQEPQCVNCPGRNPEAESHE